MTKRKQYPKIHRFIDYDIEYALHRRLLSELSEVKSVCYWQLTMFVFTGISNG